MSTTITDTSMRSDAGFTAQKIRDRGDTWVVSWLPNRQLGRNQAITALTLAEHVGTYWDGSKTVGIDRHRFHSLVQVWADELGMSKREVMQLLGSKTGSPRLSQ